MTKYIYHSEKTKTTCKECLQHDGKTFYTAKDLPQLPIHPNCKCWIETIENNSDHDKCDCGDRTEILNTNLLNILENSNSMQKSIKSELLECAIALETNPNSKDFERLQENFISINDKINSLIKSTKDLSTDIGMLKEFSYDNTYHTKGICKMTDGLNNYSNQTTALCKQLNYLAEDIKALKEKRKTLSKEAERKAKDEAKETTKGAMTGAASGVKDNIKSSLEKAQNMHTRNIELGEEMGKDLMYSAGVHIGGKCYPLANACLQDALHDFKEAKKNKNAVILNSRDEIKNKEINGFLVKTGVPRNSKGVYYNPNSKEAQTIANSEEIKDFISKNYKDLINKNTKTQNLMNFTSDKNLQYAIQHCTLINPQITQDGYFEGTIVDYFDFKHIEGEGFGVALNNWGNSMQERGLLKNYSPVFLIKVKI